MQINISGKEFIGSVGNALMGLGCFIIGGAVACSVDRALCAIARRCFNLNSRPNAGRWLNFSIKIISMGAGITATCLIAPKVALVELTARKALEILVFGMLLGVATKAMEIKKKFGPASVLLTSCMAGVGYAGSSALVPFGLIGAFAGAFLVDKKVTPFSRQNPMNNKTATVSKSLLTKHTGI